LITPFFLGKFNEGKEMIKVSVIQKVNEIMQKAKSLNASDIHFEMLENQFQVRFRIDGVLRKMELLPYIQRDEFIARIKILADLNTAEKRRPQDGKFSLKISGIDTDIRVSIILTLFGEKAVLRLLNRDSIQLNLDFLAFSTQEKTLFTRHIRNPYGMILVTGPTGSGKTTTLYTALQILNSEEINITTIEDPIEYQLAGINQTHIRPDINYTFSSALRSILRQDPDVIMVGEMRDTETAEIAIRSALTGHLVFSTIHTNDAPSTITRLLNMGVEKFLVASSIKLIIAQRLIRKICPYCKEKFTLPEQFIQDYHFPANHDFYHGKGCPECNHTGFSGRTAVFEMLEVNENIVSLIMNNAGEKEIRKEAVKQGMSTLFESSMQKAMAGITSPQEIIRKLFIYA
jgi:type II secretory ATPase GspE/PulE/Tfp pilus assembly ATPase PilB-like protein